MKLRIAKKVMEQVGGDVERPYRQSTLQRVNRRYRLTASWKEENEFWEHLMQLRRRQMAQEFRDLMKEIECEPCK